VSYLVRLAERSAAVGSYLCLGIDPHPDALPAGFGRDLAAIERFARLVLEAGLPHAAAVKVNLAFFEAYGSAGLAALERVRAAVPANVPFIADAKRGDIGSTAERQAVALFDALGADAVTASAYLGRDAIEPLLERDDRFVYVLCRTSNAAAGEVQDLPVDGEPLYLHVARAAAAWSAGRPQVGLVVGATAPDELARVRAAVPGLPFLVPGVGAQGGDLAVVLADGPASAAPAAEGHGRGLLVNVSRGIAGAAVAAAANTKVEPAAAIATAAADWAARLRC
jgi:orotidine-5'-phosphate decarboxylase